MDVQGRDTAPAAAVLVCVCVLGAAPAQAAKFLVGDAEVTIGGLVSTGTSIRTRSPDPSLIPVGNAAALGIPGTAPVGRNQDDGNLNYRRGDPVSTVVKALGNLEIKYSSYGAHLRAMAWRDFALTDGDRPWGNIPNNYTPGVPLGESSNSVYGRFSGVALLDANVYGTVNAGGVPIYGKVGNQLIPWGMPSTIAGGLSVLNPINNPASRRPGAVLDEVTIPFPALFARVGLTPALNVEAFYQFAFQRSESLGCGTFFSTFDYLADRCDKVMFGAGLNDRASLAQGNIAKRAPDPDPSDGGQFGLGLTYALESLGAQVGAYFAQYHSRSPIIGVVKARRVDPFIVGDPDGLNPRYFVEYPERIQMYGVNIVARRSDWTAFAEIVHRPNQPVQLHGTDVTNASISNTANSLIRAEYAAVPLGGIYRPFDRLTTTDILLGGNKTLGGILGAKTLLLGGDAGFKYVHDLPDVNQRRYGRSDVFGTAPFRGACSTTAQTSVSCSNDGFVSRSAFGVRARASLTYADVFADTDVVPLVSYGYDLKGWSYDGIFSEGRQFALFSLRSEYSKRYAAELAYLKVWGGHYNNARDRDMMTMVVSARF
jgi:hypothetical protein